VVKLRLDLHALGYRQGEQWIFHCLEMDVMGHAATPQDAMERMLDAINAQVEFSIENDNLANIFQPADPEFWKMYAMAQDSPLPASHMKSKFDDSAEITGFESRTYEAPICV
jgi:hypothetical protein